jgi:predicted ester cyclase
MSRLARPTAWGVADEGFAREHAQMTKATKELVRRHFEEIWNDRDDSACDTLMAAEYVEHATAPFGTRAPGRVNGPLHMRSTRDWLLDQFPDLHMTVEALVSELDMVVARVVSEGTNTGKLNGVIPPTGKRFKARQTHWFRVQDGQLAEHWATRDDLTTMLQLGLVSKPRLGAMSRQVVPSVKYWYAHRRN